VQRLSDLLYRVPLLEVVGRPDAPVADFQFDSRKVGEGMLYIAQRGTQADGHRFIPDAILAGATVIVCQEMPDVLDPEVTYVRVKDSAQSLAHLAANFYGNPAEKLKIIGVTGTNGKTTVASLLYQLFRKLDHRVGLVSTVSVLIDDLTLPATHTTPDPKSLHLYFRNMVQSGCTHCFMEVSSHALHQKRVAGIPFAGALFTNLTHDHLDYHGTFEAYRDAKKLLFDMLPGSAFALTNLDDRNGNFMLQNTAARKLTYSLRQLAGYRARVVEQRLDGMLLMMDGTEVWVRLVGEYNAYNLLLVYAAARELGLDPQETLLELSTLAPVRGRMELVPLPGQVTGIVDYAHTPDALKNVILTLQELRPVEGRLIIVVGCGGNRDAAKRPEMGKIASEAADVALFISDNPRYEDSDAILHQMVQGVPAAYRKRVTCITNRREALQIAARLAQPHDVILVAGKGHETYQEIESVKHPFDDREELQRAFNQLHS
jgi:UDP-N-acetylmuramoyl-L-alanyl-D-glutamate--2,6-diaminopimelate ligase